MLNRTTSLADQLRDNHWVYRLAGVVCALAAGLVLADYGMTGALLVIGVPAVLIVVMGVLLEPRLGLLIYVNLSFILGASRFLETEAPVGVSLDAILWLTLLSVFLNGKRMAWGRLKHPVFYLLIVWLTYTLLEYFNPDAPAPEAWFYHIRSFSLNWFFIAIIVFVMPITRSDIKVLVVLWVTWSVLAALWAFHQQYIGLTGPEQRWLAQGYVRTHILYGQLRSFSFYSDAGQFGSEMAGVTLLCLIWFFEGKQWSYRVGYLALALLLFWGFAVSGTRSALFGLLAGFPSYLFLKRKAVPIIRGIAIAIPVMLILMFTHIGDSNYHIFRLRTALRPTEDASFLVRLENQAKLRNYLKDLPFGAGIGSSSGAGQRFSPNHFASQTPTDSWYVQIWIETGVVGLSLYLFVVVGIILVGVYKVWQINDEGLRVLMIALLSEFIGIALVSYSNPIMGQFPTSTMLFINCVLFSTGERWDSKPATVTQKLDRTPAYLYS